MKHKVLSTVPLAFACAREPAPDSRAPAAAPAPSEPATGEPHSSHPHAAHTMHHRFEDAEQWAKTFDDPARDEWQKPAAVVAKLGLEKNAIVADIGAGTGYFTVKLAAAVPKGKVFALDVEADMVRYLDERAKKDGLGNVVAMQSRPDNPELVETVDVAFLCDVVHHIEDRTAYFAKLKDRLRPGGRIVIVDFSPDAPDDGPGPPKQHRLSIATLDQELGASDLERTMLDRELLPYQYIVEYRPKRRRKG